MKFDYQMAVILKDALEKQGITRNFPIYNEEFFEYSKSELEKITELELIGVPNLSGIDLLPNLKKLRIHSFDFTHVTSSVDLEEGAEVNTIKDFSIISKLSALEELDIQNNTYIKTLDISQLKQLKKIILINNPELETLIGLDELENLQNICIYGTQISSYFNIEKYIENTVMTDINILDINMYASIVRGNRSVSRMISDMNLIGKTNVLFGEYIGFMNVSILDSVSASDMFTKFDTLFKKYQLYEANDLDKIQFVYNYVIKNIRFDLEGLGKRQQTIDRIVQEGQEIPNYLKKNFASFHNSYIAFRFKKANCEGFVNLMKFMFNMLGIKCFNVHCIDKRFENVFVPNHSLIRLEYNKEWYYCDPTYDRKYPQYYFMKKYEELQDSHLLNAYEASVSEEYTNEKRNGITIR